MSTPPMSGPASCTTRTLHEELGGCSVPDLRLAYADARQRMGELLKQREPSPDAPWLAAFMRTLQIEVTRRGYSIA